MPTPKNKSEATIVSQNHDNPWYAHMVIHKHLQKTLSRKLACVNYTWDMKNNERKDVKQEEWTLVTEHATILNGRLRDE